VQEPTRAFLPIARCRTLEVQDGFFTARPLKGLCLIGTGAEAGLIYGWVRMVLIGSLSNLLPGSANTRLGAIEPTAFDP
jgi:hypothetical protein